MVSRTGPSMASMPWFDIRFKTKERSQSLRFHFASPRDLPIRSTPADPRELPYMELLFNGLESSLLMTTFKVYLF